MVEKTICERIEMVVLKILRDLLEILCIDVEQIEEENEDENEAYYEDNGVPLLTKEEYEARTEEFYKNIETHRAGDKSKFITYTLEELRKKMGL
jgi:hypothetical protein